MIKIDPSAEFVALVETNKSVVLTPKTSDLGSFQLYLISQTTSDPPSMLVQQVLIKVFPDKDSQYQDVEASISSISRTGLVFIDFNQ